MPMNAKIIFHQDLGKICHFSDVNLVDEDIEKALKDSSKEFQPKISSQIGILDFSTPLQCLARMEKSEILVSLDSFG